jgi:WD40 repeat protein
MRASRWAILTLVLTAGPTAAQPRVDRFGDPLPAGALFRIGTARLRLDARMAAIAVAPDGKRIAAIGGNRLAVWELPGGREILRTTVAERVPGDTTACTFMAFTADGKQIAFHYKYAKPVVYDIVSGRQRQEFKNHSVDGVASLNGRTWTLHQVDDQGQPVIVQFDAATAKPIKEWPLRLPVTADGRPGRFPAGPWFSPDGRIVVTLEKTANAAQQTLRLYEAATGDPVRHWTVADFHIHQVAVSPDAKWLGALGGLGVVRVWDIGGGKEQMTEPLEDTVELQSLFAFAPDGNSLLCTHGSGGIDQRGEIGRWDWRTGKRLMDYPGSRLPIALVPGGKLLAAQGPAQALHLVRLETGQPLGPIPRPGSHVAFAADGRKVAWAEAGTLVLGDATSGKEIRRVGTDLFDDTPLAFAPDGQSIAAVTSDHQVQRWRTSDGHLLGRLSRKSLQRPDWVTFSPDGQRFAVGGNYDAWIANVNSDKPIGEWYSLAHVCIDSTLQTVALSDARAQIIQIVDVPSGRVQRELSRHGYIMWEVALAYRPVFAPHGRWLLAAGRSVAPGEDGIAHSALWIWDLATGKPLAARLDGTEYHIHNVGVSPDSRLLALLNAEGRICLVSTTSGKVRHMLGTARDELSSAIPRFTPDGRLLITAVQERVQVWEIASGGGVVRLDGHRSRVHTLIVSPDGSRLATVGADQTIVVWDLAHLAAPDPGVAATPDRLWEELAQRDAVGGRTAIEGLVAAPHLAIPLFRERLKPVAAPPAKQLARWIAELDSEDFGERQRAERELERLGELAGPALLQHLATMPSLEARRRIEPLLRKLEVPAALSADVLRDVRAVQVLEGIGCVEARQILQTLAKGAPGARLTEDAAAAFLRLQRIPPSLDGR